MTEQGLPGRIYYTGRQIDIYAKFSLIVLRIAKRTVLVCFRWLVVTHLTRKIHITGFLGNSLTQHRLLYRIISNPFD